MSGYLSINGGIFMQRREKGTGTIIKTETGYKGKIDIGRGPDGKRKFKCFSGKTEAEVKRKIREYNKSGAPTNPRQILLKDYLMSWLVNIKRISLKPSSYDRLAENTPEKSASKVDATHKIPNAYAFGIFIASLFLRNDGKRPCRANRSARAFVMFRFAGAAASGIAGYRAGSTGPFCAGAADGCLAP